jgi:hypothetical protein
MNSRRQGRSEKPPFPYARGLSGQGFGGGAPSTASRSPAPGGGGEAPV